MNTNFFLCFRCETVFPQAAYHAHMDAAHEGRHDCVLGLNPAAEAAYLAGADVNTIAKAGTTRSLEDRIAAHVLQALCTEDHDVERTAMSTAARIVAMLEEAA